MYEKQLEQIDGARTTLETQKLALEQLNINKEVLDAQRAGAATMASVAAAMGGVDAVDDAMGQIEEGLADANEIGEALSRPVAGGLDMDEDDLLAELEVSLTLSWSLSLEIDLTVSLIYIYIYIFIYRRSQGPWRGAWTWTRTTYSQSWR